MWEYTQALSSDELYHHGVLGMKLDMRRASKKVKEEYEWV